MLLNYIAILSLFIISAASTIRLMVTLPSLMSTLAMLCAAPTALDTAGILDGRNFTAYIGKVAVMMAEGYEEGETLTIVDILRRADITAHTFSLKGSYVKGMHGIQVKADKILSDEIKDYDVIVLPGGRPGGMNLCQSENVIEIVKYFDENNKFITAMCSGTTVLEKADVIHGRNVTGYVGYAEKLPSGNFIDKVVVRDGNLITSQGPATVYPFALSLCEALGKSEEANTIAKRTLYKFAGGRCYK